MNKHYGPYGGQYVAETLMGPLNELAAAYFEARKDSEFQREFESLLKDYVGRESPITVCRRLSAALGGATIALKREDLNHTGAHKVNNTIGQALLARRSATPGATRCCSTPPRRLSRQTSRQRSRRDS